MGAKQSVELPVADEEAGDPVHDLHLDLQGRRRNTQYAQRLQGMARMMTNPRHTRTKARLGAAVVEEEEDFAGNKEGKELMKQLYKKLDPTVMKTIGVIQGEIQLSFKYDFNSELLLIKVIKCRDLDAKDLRGKNANTYVKLSLFPDDDQQRSKSTQVVKQSLNPVYSEIFSYVIQEPGLVDSRLIVQVWNKDVMGRDDFMGECLVKLNAFNFREDPVHTAWYDLQMETDLGISGDLNLTLAYRLPQTLLVTVHSATDLSKKNGDRSSPFVKVTIPGVAQVEQTEIIKGTLNPVWEETFEFQVPQEEFGYRYLVFQVIDSSADAESDALGQVIIDLNNLDPEHGYSGPFGLEDLKNSERLRDKWAQKAIVQEFRESLLAHSTFKEPKFLFQKQSGNKVITVTSRKAGTQAKLRIVNGLPVY
ncbi:synaptotagmin-6 [Lingula anatina]|uniref:Synaptotagmin-6 n=1 Tax=Lingula anatina TaxID=7574 RepID=A0A1S3JGE6_LINAN|nr:synaptotagmin-6 [Lingula anatina]|eukprot:XP_013409216.1 synaptotagmin-6 [Lingula anatina]